MPMRRRRAPFRRRRPVRRFRRQGYGRRSIVPRPMVMRRPTSVHHFKNTYIPTSLTVGGGSGASYDAAVGLLLGPTGTTNAGFALGFTIGETPNASSIGSLFDSYRINKVVVKFRPVQNMMGIVSLAAPAGELTQPLMTCIDHDDIVVPALSDVQAYSSLKETSPWQMHKRVLVPAVALAAFRTGVTFGYTPGYRKWIDLAQADVEHYGLKGAIRAAAVSGNNYRNGWYVSVTMYYSCKDVR